MSSSSSNLNNDNNDNNNELQRELKVLKSLEALRHLLRLDPEVAPHLIAQVIFNFFLSIERVSSPLFLFCLFSKLTLTLILSYSHIQDIINLHKLAMKLRQKRLQHGVLKYEK
jgi:hypothetical protein